MSEFPLTTSNRVPSIPEIGADLASHTRALEAIREILQVAGRRSGDRGESFVRVSELVALGIAEIQAGRLVVRRPTPPQVLTTGERDALVNPQDGTLIYNSTTNTFQGREAGAWVSL